MIDSNIYKINRNLISNVSRETLNELEVYSNSIISKSKTLNLIIPENLNYDSFSGLSNEVKSKFKKIRPKTMGQALRIDGITPAAVYIL